MIEVINSGSEVPIAKIATPMTKGEIPNDRPTLSDEAIKKFDPTSKTVRLTANRKIAENKQEGF
jgi:hypothetical protein